MIFSPIRHALNCGDKGADVIKEIPTRHLPFLQFANFSLVSRPGNLRIGRIMPGLVSGLHVRTADGDFKLEALGDISVKGAAALVVALHDPAHGASVVQAVESKLAGYVTTADEATVTILAPKVTKELRSAMVKQAKEKAEEVCVCHFRARRSRLDSACEYSPHAYTRNQMRVFETF